MITASPRRAPQRQSARTVKSKRKDTPMLRTLEPPRRFRVLDTSAECIDPRQRPLLEAHLKRRLARAELAKLDRHCEACFACAITLVNANVMAKASRHFGIEVGPRLVPHLERVPVVSPSRGRTDPRWPEILSMAGCRSGRK